MVLSEDKALLEYQINPWRRIRRILNDYWWGERNELPIKTLWVQLQTSAHQKLYVCLTGAPPHCKHRKPIVILKFHFEVVLPHAIRLEPRCLASRAEMHPFHIVLGICNRQLLSRRMTAAVILEADETGNASNSSRPTGVGCTTRPSGERVVMRKCPMLEERKDMDFLWKKEHGNSTP